MEVFKSFTFEAAHSLPNVPPDHKCRRLHGHSFRVDVHVRGRPDERLGWVIDFGRITQAFQPLHEQLDHRYLNEVEDLRNPTSENVARWIWARLATTLPGLYQVVVHETCTSGCTYRGEDD